MFDWQILFDFIKQLLPFLFYVKNYLIYNKFSQILTVQSKNKSNWKIVVDITSS